MTSKLPKNVTERGKAFLSQCEIAGAPEPTVYELKFTEIHKAAQEGRMGPKQQQMFEVICNNYQQWTDYALDQRIEQLYISIRKGMC